MFNLFENTQKTQCLRNSAVKSAYTLWLLTVVVLLGAPSTMFAQQIKARLPEQRLVTNMSKGIWGNWQNPLDQRRLADTSKFPFSAIVKLRVTFPDGTITDGTGALIAPNKVLTAEHVVYNESYGGHFSLVEIMPGYSGNYESCRKIVSVEYSHGSHQGCHKGAKCDIAVLTAQESVGCDTGWFGFKIPTIWDLNQIYVAGYPEDLYDSEYLVVGSGKAFFAQSPYYHNILGYDVWTYGGMSGGPIFTADFNIIGVHTNGSTEANYGVSLCNELFTTIYNWRNQ